MNFRKEIWMLPLSAEDLGSSAAIAQSSGIGQVNQAVRQLDPMTQQNSALVEASAAAASSMSERAGRLTQAVAAFRMRSNLAA